MSAVTQLNVIVDKAIKDRLQGQMGTNIRKFVGNEILTLSDPLIPYRDGPLKNSGEMAEDGSYVMWSTPYAKRWYYEPANFIQNGTGVRGNHWAERAWNLNRNDILKGINALIKKGGL